MTGILLLAIVTSTVTLVATVRVEAQSGKSIDLFTQRGGIGPNESSDMFQPQELVMLYANVTYNGSPVAGKLVSFQADGPPNAFQNFTVAESSNSDASGVATVSFRVPWPSEDAEQKVFGVWRVTATVDIADETVVDTMTFRVGWMVEITSVATLNAELKPQETFERGSTIVFNLTVKNNAQTAKPATLTVYAEDSAGYPIIHAQLDNLVLQPGASPFNVSARVPEDAAVGTATVSAAAYNAPVEQGGVLYSPANSTTFEIVPVPTLVHDVAITNVTVSQSVGHVGDRIQVSVRAANLGNYNETFNVTVYYENSMMFVRRVTSLPPNQTMMIESTWDTSKVEAGAYRIRAEAQVVPREVNTTNNVFTDGKVTLLSRAAVLPTFSVLLVLMLFLILVVGAVLTMFLIMASRMKRRKKRVPHSYAVIVHPHV